MTPTLRLPLLSTAVAVASALALASPAHAITVFDPTNYAQNLLQAARALEQVKNQITSLQNEAQMLIGQAKNLVSLDFPAIDALKADIAEVNGLLTQAGRLASDVKALREQFERQYPVAAPAGASGAALTKAAEGRWTNALESLRRTLEVQAGVANGLSATVAQAASIAGRSDGAVGALQAAQAGNQLLAVQSKQLADVTALLAAQGQAEALEQARAAAAATDAKARLTRFLGAR